ncbi:Rid family detoxifying hydrolase [Candidatus Parcubacteria bacterium]|nr:Rid family detoxifying hydrolase [Candidatus Parcubacteria bacterium]
MSAFGPYSAIRQAGDLYFVSGQVGVDSDSKESSGSIEEQTRQALKNLKNVLESAGLSLGNVVKTTVFLRNMDDFESVNEIYSSYFAGIPPARSCVAVSELPKVSNNTILIEIEAVAYKKNGHSS